MSTVGLGRRVTPLLGLLLVLGACAPAPFAGLEMGPRRAKYRERILGQTLKNGLRVVMLPDKRSNLVMVSVHYAVGGSDDPNNGEGLAHYVEHVMFEAGYRGADGNALRDVGLDKNASTSFDRTFFYLKALDVELESALEIAARRFEATCDDIDAATLARERDVVIEEEKLRSKEWEVTGGVFRAVWGADHPYGRNPGGHGFAALPRPALCKFIEEHYGPASAVLVVSGNVRDEDFQRIRSRFERIPARSAAKRVAHTAPIKTSRVVVNELERPAALVVFSAPGDGTAADAAVDALDGLAWRLESGAPAGYAVTRVVGEQRERAIVAIAEVEDAKRLEELANAMVRTFSKAKVEGPEFAMYKERRRTILAAKLDDTFASAEPLAAAVARGERPTRFRELQQLEQLTAADMKRLLDAPKVRVAFLLPQVGAAGKQHATDIATSLHDVDVPGGSVSGTQSPQLPTTRPQITIIEHRLRNGLRVLLAPDSDAVAVDARLIIDGTRDESASGLDMKAALFLTPDAGELPAQSVVERLQWYSRIGAPVSGLAGEDSTTFQIRGLTLWADWHVWNLGWTVLRGSYRETMIDALRDQAAKAKTKTKPPSSTEVVARRLAGVGGMPDSKVTIPAAKSLEAFRQARYRPERSTLIVSGNFDAAAMRKEINTIFGEWEPQRGATAAGAASQPRVGSAIGIEADDERTVEISIAFAPTKKATASEIAARAVLDEIVERRMRVVRERLGASYGVHAASGRRAILISGAVEPAYAGEAAKAIAVELERIRTGDASVLDEFVRARKRVLAAALAMPVGASNRAAALERVVRDGGDIKKLDGQVEAIRALEFTAVQQIAARDMQPERMIAAARGERNAVEATLIGLGIAKEKIEWFGLAKAKGSDPRAPAEMPKLTIRDGAATQK
jgi:zinc protease